MDSASAAYHGPDAVHVVQDPPEVQTLTAREYEVLIALSQGEQYGLSASPRGPLMVACVTTAN
jgi:hypothetical protein